MKQHIIVGNSGTGASYMVKAVSAKDSSPAQILAIEAIVAYRAGETQAIKASILKELNDSELEQLMDELTTNHFNGYEECQAFRDTFGI